MAPVHTSATAVDVYQAYVRGEHVLTANESQQIGMRLAKKLGLPVIHAVDHKQDMDLEGMMRAGAEAGQQEVLAWFQSEISNVQGTLASASWWRC